MRLLTGATMLRFACCMTFSSGISSSYSPKSVALWGWSGEEGEGREGEKREGERGGRGEGRGERRERGGKGREGEREGGRERREEGQRRREREESMKIVEREEWGNEVIVNAKTGRYIQYEIATYLSRDLYSYCYYYIAYCGPR